MENTLPSCMGIVLPACVGPLTDRVTSVMHVSGVNSLSFCHGKTSGGHVACPKSPSRSTEPMRKCRISHTKHTSQADDQRHDSAERKGYRSDARSYSTFRKLSVICLIQTGAMRLKYCHECPPPVVSRSRSCNMPDDDSFMPNRAAPSNHSWSCGSQQKN